MRSNKLSAMQRFVVIGTGAAVLLLSFTQAVRLPTTGGRLLSSEHNKPGNPTARGVERKIGNEDATQAKRHGVCRGSMFWFARVRRGKSPKCKPREDIFMFVGHVSSVVAPSAIMLYG